MQIARQTKQFWIISLFLAFGALLGQPTALASCHEKSAVSPKSCCVREKAACHCQPASAVSGAANVQDCNCLTAPEPSKQVPTRLEAGIAVPALLPGFSICPLLPACVDVDTQSVLIPQFPRFSVVAASPRAPPFLA